MYTELSDRELVDRILGGDEQASEAFCERFWRFLRAVVAREWGRYPYMTSEIPQDVFLRLFDNDCRALRRWQGRGDIAPYLATITRNVARDYRRHRSPGPWQPVDDDTTLVVDPEPGPEERAWTAERRTRVRAAVAELEDRDRELIERRYLNEEECAEIARDLGMKLNAFYVALHRALGRLGSVLEESGQEPHLRRRPLERM